MDEKKRKKSGHESRIQKRNKLLHESAKACSKITAFLPKSSNHEATSTISENEVSSLETELKESVDQGLVEEFHVTFSDAKSAEPTQESYSEPELSPSPSKLHLIQGNSLTEVIDYFQKPRPNDLQLYLEFHPIQPDEKELPFTERKSIFKIEESNSGSQMFRRQWLSYNNKKQQLVCFICVALSKSTSVFCSGFSDWKHVHQRLQEHETSKTHIEAVDAFMLMKTKKSLPDLLFEKQMSKRKQEVKERRHVVEAVIDVLKLIGKQGLSFRGKVESAHTLDDESVNHGNFLEIILMLKKYDAILEKHLSNVITKSKIHQSKKPNKNQEQKKISKGRGGQVTFLSNNTIGNIFKFIKEEIKRKICEEVKLAGKYSILMDTTIDVSGLDQCAYVLRYVKNSEIVERLVAVKSVVSTTGEDLFNSLKIILEDANIPLKNCVANAFDGASNMNGQFKGVTARLSEVIPHHIHTWCYAHVLNLVLTDTAQCLIATISFFNVLQETQVFMKESFKRLQKFIEENPSFKLEAIGMTRWRSRSNATTKIFGRIDDWDGAEKQLPTKLVYLELVVALTKISNSPDFNSKIRSEAEGLLNKFVSFDTILIAMMFLQIFKITTPLSDYLQTKNLDFVQAFRLIETTLLKLKELREKFDETLKAAETFVAIMTNNLDNRSETDDSLENIVIETKLKEKRKRKRKKLPGENHVDIIHTSAKEAFRINTFYCVIDTVVNTMENRFLQHKTLYLDMAWFDPKRFTNKEPLPPKALDKIAEILPEVNKGKLAEQLTSFADAWPKFSKPTIREDYEEDDDTELDLSADDQDEEEKSTFTPCNSTKCNSCLKCAYEVLFNYNMYSRQYSELFTVYKFLLTIPMTQVTCERVFSKLKIVKTRLRSTLSNDILETLLFMQSETDLLNTIDSDIIIDKLCQSSFEMRRLLSV